MKNDGFTFRKRARSFKFAFNGIKLLITKEHNAWIHCFAAVCVLIAGMVFGLSRMEWIAVTIVIGQLKDFFGISYPDGVKPIETTEKLKAFFENFSTFNFDALIVGGVSLAILILAPYVLKKVPGSLPAVIVGILMVKFLPLKVATSGNL